MSNVDNPRPDLGILARLQNAQRDRDAALSARVAAEGQRDEAWRALATTRGALERIKRKTCTMGTDWGDSEIHRIASGALEATREYGDEGDHHPRR